MPGVGGQPAAPEPHASSGVQRSGDARGECVTACPLPKSSIQQWRVAVIVTGHTLFVTSQYDAILMFANRRFNQVC